MGSGSGPRVLTSRSARRLQSRRGALVVPACLVSCLLGPAARDTDKNLSEVGIDSPVAQPSICYIRGLQKGKTQRLWVQSQGPREEALPSSRFALPQVARRLSAPPNAS